MGDRAWVGITFYEVPAEHAEAVQGFLVNQGMLEPDADVVLGEQYTYDEMYIGWLNDEVLPLTEQCPSVIVEAHQDQKYEWSAEVLYHTPALGTFVSAAIDGAPVLNMSAVSKLYATASLSGVTGAPALYDALKHHFGEPWRNVISPLEDKLRNIPEAERTIILLRCSQCDEPLNQDDPHAGHGMCASCLHNALRSGWTPGEEN